MSISEVEIKLKIVPLVPQKSPLEIATGRTLVELSCSSGYVSRFYAAYRQQSN
jgi:hypothetical protein